MIVGGYDLHLYCRNELPISYSFARKGPCPAGHHEDGQDRAEFFGSNERQACVLARRAGWKFTGGNVLCPQCAKAKP